MVEIKKRIVEWKAGIIILIVTAIMGLGILYLILLSAQAEKDHNFCLNHYSVSISNSTDTRYFISGGKCCAYVERYNDEGCHPFEKIIWGECSGTTYRSKVCVEIEVK